MKIKPPAFRNARAVLLSILFSGLLLSNGAFAYQLNVTGKVTSASDNEGMPGVNVVLKGTSQGTVTDVNGTFTIAVPSSSAVLIFTSVGFDTQESGQEQNIPSGQNKEIINQ